MFYSLPSLRFRPSLDMPSFTTMVQSYMPIYHYMNQQERFSYVIRIPYYYEDDERELVLQLPISTAHSDGTSSAAPTSTSTLSSIATEDERFEKSNADSAEQSEKLKMLAALNEALGDRSPAKLPPSLSDIVENQLTLAILTLARRVNGQRKAF